MTAETVETASLNGTAPATDQDEPCADCATGGEKLMAGLALLFGLFIIAMAADMFTGGRVTGLIREQVGQ